MDSNNGSDSPPPIVMAVDLSDPTEVQPIIERFRSVIRNVYDSKEKDSTTMMPNPYARTTTTSMKSLQRSTFGTCKIQEEVKGASTSSEQRIALILAVIVPSTLSASSTSAAEEYKERQARALLLYHLHKFSLELNCTLCFVSDKSNSSETSGGGTKSEGEEKVDGAAENDPLLGRNTTMSIEELGKVIRRVAMGLSPVELNELDSNHDEKEEGKGEGKEEDDAASPQRPPSIHVPGSHDAELIHGAYLRNASCEGRWDAGKDDLNVALPPTSEKATKEEPNDDSKIEGGTGDEEWLSQLASSIGLSPDAAAAAVATSSSAGEALTPTAADRAAKRKDKPAVKKRIPRASVRNKDAKPKDEKEVMSFFDNLLKK